MSPFIWLIWWWYSETVGWNACTILGQPCMAILRPPFSLPVQYSWSKADSYTWWHKFFDDYINSRLQSDWPPCSHLYKAWHCTSGTSQCCPNELHILAISCKNLTLSWLSIYAEDCNNQYTNTTQKLLTAIYGTPVPITLGCVAPPFQFSLDYFSLNEDLLTESL